MKYIQAVNIILLFIFTLAASLPVWAEETTITRETTPSATISPTSIPLDTSIQTLKEKIASKVAELSQNTKKVNAGVIVKKKSDLLEIKNAAKQTLKLVIDDSVTKLYTILSGVKKTAGLDDFSVGDFIIVLGPLIEETINANAIYKSQKYETQSGKIIDIDQQEYTIKLITGEKDEYTLDIEKTTKQFVLDVKTLKINAGGFSKMKEGDIIHFAIKKKPEENTLRASAVRILTIPSGE